MKKLVKVGLIVTCFLLIIGLVGCQGYKPAYKEPNTKDAFDTPFIVDEELTDEEELFLDEDDFFEEAEDEAEEEEEFEEAEEDFEEAVEPELIPEEDEEDFAPAVPSNVPTLTVTEGDTVKIKVKATDPDGDSLEYNFGEPLSSTGTWKTQVGDAGEYLTSIKVSDGKTTTNKMVNIIVIALNLPPTVYVPKVITVDEGEKVVIDVDVTDPDGDAFEITYTGWSNQKVKQTGYEDAGTYTVTVTVSDGLNTVKKDVKIVVNDVNRAPVVELEF